MSTEISTPTQSSMESPQVIPGRPVSNRVWKREKKKTSSVVSVPQLRSSWKVKEERRQQLKNMKEREKMIRDEKQKAYEEQRERIKRNREMREKNALKNVKYQIVTDTAKLKKVSKKQWKNYRKLADINKF